jgi:hypothetical protein
MVKDSKTGVLYVVIMVLLAIIIIILSLRLINSDTELDRSKNDLDNLKRDKQIIQDSILKLDSLNKMYNNDIVIYRDSLEVLSKVKQKTIIKYRDQKKFVSDATIHQLDSIIRANTTIGF